MLTVCGACGEHLTHTPSVALHRPPPYGSPLYRPEAKQKPRLRAGDLRSSHSHSLQSQE